MTSKKTYNLRINEESFDQLKVIATEQELPISGLLRAIVKNYLKRKANKRIVNN